MSLNETFRRATSFLPNTLASLSVPQIVEVILSRRRQSVWNWGIIYRAKGSAINAESLTTPAVSRVFFFFSTKTLVFFGLSVLLINIVGWLWPAKSKSQLDRVVMIAGARQTRKQKAAKIS